MAYSPSFIAQIISHLIGSLEYSPKDPISEQNATYQALKSEVAMYNDGEEWFDNMCREATSLAEASI